MEPRELRLETQPFAVGGIEDSARKEASAPVRPISESVASGREAIGALAAKAIDSGRSDLETLRSDLDRLINTVTDFMSQVRKEAGETARDVAAGIEDQAGDLAAKGAKMGAAATEQGKTFAADLEQMVRRNPIGAIAGAVTVGVVIGLLGRRN